jgi:hypothetical protein
MWGGIDQQLYGIDGGRSAIADTIEEDLANAALDFGIRHRGR